MRWRGVWKKRRRRHWTQWRRPHSSVSNADKKKQWMHFHDILLKFTLSLCTLPRFRHQTLREIGPIVKKRNRSWSRRGRGLGWRRNGLIGSGGARSQQLGGSRFGTYRTRDRCYAVVLFGSIDVFCTCVCIQHWARHLSVCLMAFRTHAIPNDEEESKRLQYTYRCILQSKH